MFHNNHQLMFRLLCAAAMVLAWSGVSQAAASNGHGKDCVSASIIESGGKATTSFENSKDIAVYKIELPRRGLLDVWMEPDSFDIENVQLLDASCHPITTVNAGISVISESFAHLTIPSTELFSDRTIYTLDSGVYFIRIIPDSILVMGETFTVNTRFTPHFGHDFATAEPVVLNGSIEGSLFYGTDREVFSVSLKEGGELSASTSMKEKTNHAPKIGFYFADCLNAATKVRTENRPDGETGISTYTLAPGMYYITIDPNDPEDLGDFVLNLHFNPKPDNKLDPNVPPGVCHGF